MKCRWWAVWALLVIVTPLTLAQPPDGPQDEEGPSRRPGRPGRGMGPPIPLVGALDANQDGEISAEEIEGAAAALKKLDEDGDGKLTRREFLPRPPRGPRGPERREGAGPGPGEGDRPDRPRRPGRGPGNPDRFIERALSFDADEDGKLDRDELRKWAEEMVRRRGPEQ